MFLHFCSDRVTGKCRHVQRQLLLSYKRGLLYENVVARSGLRNKTSIKQLRKVNTKRILGEGAVDVNTGLQSAVPIIRKAVFHIDNRNISPASTVTTVQDHLQRHNIQVLPCHGAKSWMRDDEKDQVVAFRACIRAELKDRLMDTMTWPKVVIVRAWKFKNNNHQ